MATGYRAAVARGIYLAQDRSDIQFPVNKLSRKMSKPNTGDFRKLRKLGRYLMGSPRMVQ